MLQSTEPDKVAPREQVSESHGNPKVTATHRLEFVLEIYLPFKKKVKDDTY